MQKRALVELSEAPKSFLSKVLQRMVAQGLIRSWRGAGGGFELARPADQISVLMVVEAIDGPVHLNRCVPGASGCELGSACTVQPVWTEARDALVDILGKATMSELTRNRRVTLPRAHREIVDAVSDVEADCVGVQPPIDVP